MMNLIYIKRLETETEHHYILPTLGMSISTSQMTSVLYTGMMNLIYIEILETETEHHYILLTLGMSMSTSQMTSVLYRGGW